MTQVKERGHFRVAPETDRLVRQAAQTAERTPTDFVVDAAVVEAERLLVDRREFALDAEQWDQFVALLDRSPHDNPGSRGSSPDRPSSPASNRNPWPTATGAVGETAPSR